MTHPQVYDPFGNLALSAVVAAVPLILLLGMLGLLRARAHVAAGVGLGAALAVAVVGFGMPAPLAAAAAIDGAAYGLFPIGWIVLNAIFLYDVTVRTGGFARFGASIAALSPDRRIQVLLIAFCFGAFLEGAAGFGTPVAISAAMLIGLGFPPLQAATLALLGNTAPVAFAALGTPVLALQQVTGLPLMELSAAIGRTLAIPSLIVPFWIVAVLAGVRGMLGVWPACLTVGLAYAATQLLVSTVHGPWLVSIASSMVALVALVMLLRVWQPGGAIGTAAAGSPGSAHPGLEPATLAGREMRTTPGVAGATPPAERSPATVHRSRRELLVAWLPWILLTLLVFVWATPDFRQLVSGTNLTIGVPVLDGAVVRMPPVVTAPHAEAATFVLDWLPATGTAILLSAVASGILLGLGARALLACYVATLRRVGRSLLTIAAMLALGFTMRYAGTDATLGLAFASTGALFAFASPLLGWIGVAVTGSDTSSNVLFGNLQAITAQRLGVSPVLAAAANSAGGVMGKMIAAPSIVVAGIATEQQGMEASVLRAVFPHSVALALVIAVIVLVQAHLALPL